MEALQLDGTYARESARPLVSLIFVAPLLAVYEIGVLWLGPQSLRNGADVWLRTWLESIGFGQYFLLPVLTCSILLAWHHVGRQRWSIRPAVLLRMSGECLALAAGLLCLATIQHRCFQAMLTTAACPGGETLPAVPARLVGYCGAGIYEELLFRLMLLPALLVTLRWFGLAAKPSLVLSVLGSSLIFSAAHYQFFTAAGESFAWYSFSFRCAAGVFFSILFVQRGFGIAAGSHALYDMLVELT